MVLIGLKYGGVFTTLPRELASIILYDLTVVLIAILLREIIKTIKGLGIITPILILASAIFSPVFLDFKEGRSIQRFCPTFHYLYSTHDSYYLKNLIQQLEVDGEGELNIQIKITKNFVSVELNLSESLLVLNALATKKIALRGGAWSAIGKRIEKPLLIKLCKICGVSEENYNAENFVHDKNLDFDREVDFKLYGKKEYRCEVKLMGGGNPESADAVIARNSDIFIADTLSKQNKNQLDSLGICWIEMKNHSHEDILNQFRKILKKLEIPFTK